MKTGGAEALTRTVLNRMANNTGCSLYHDCLTCPYPECRYDGTEARNSRTQQDSKKGAVNG